MNQPVKKAILPIAGLGTRFLPATKAIPKEMMTLVDRPLIQHAIEEARAAGIEEFIFVTARGKTSMEDHFDDKPELAKNLRDAGKHDLLRELEATNMPSGAVAYIRQTAPRGLAHAIWCARRIVDNEPVAILLPDDVFLGSAAIAELQEAWVNSDASAMIAAVEVPRAQIGAYGCLSLGERVGKTAPIRDMVEKPKPEEAPSTTAIAGRYIMNYDIMREIDRLVRTTPEDQEVQFTDALLSGAQGNAHAVYIDGERFDCGSKIGFLEANLAFGLARPEFRDRLLKKLDHERKRYE